MSIDTSQDSWEFLPNGLPAHRSVDPTFSDILSATCRAVGAYQGWLVTASCKRWFP